MNVSPTTVLASAALTAGIALSAAPAGAQTTGAAAGAWRVTCASGKCNASQTARYGASPATLRISAGPTVSVEGGTYASSGVVVVALDGVETTFLPIGPELRDAGHRVVIGPNEMSRELVAQFSHAKRATITLPAFGGGEAKADFDLAGFAAAVAKVK